MREVQTTLNYVADPHTAVAIAAAEKAGYHFITGTSPGVSIPMVILSTASPLKFQKAVTIALGEEGWEEWERECFPPRARRTLEQIEVKPIHYPKREGYSFNDLQIEWRKMMIGAVNDNFF